MAKYSFELKLEVVQAYERGEGGYNYLAEKYKIGTGKNGKYLHSSVRKWVEVYRKYGIDGLRRKRKNEFYTFEFKMDMVQLYLSSEMSYKDLALNQGFNDPTRIAGWVKKYRDSGIDGLRNKSKGRPSKMKDTKDMKTTITEVQNTSTDPSIAALQKRLEELERELRLTRIENDYLKEMRSLWREHDSGIKENELLARIIHKLRGKHQLSEILEVLDFPKSTYMYWQRNFDRPNPDQEIEDIMLEVRAEHKDAGYRPMTNALRDRGFKINEKKVRRLMQKLNLGVRTYTKKSRRYNSYRGTIGTIAPNLLKRRFKTSVPHQKITTDTTEFKYYEVDNKGIQRIKKLYLNPFMDLYNNEIISYSISKRPTFEPIMNALVKAIEITSDCEFRRTFHSDQGWAYQMKAYGKQLKDNKIFQSMSRKGNCLDNATMESFFGTLKQEIYHGNIFNSYEELVKEIEDYIYYYNNKRMKKKLGYLSPVEFRINQMNRKIA